MKRKSKLKGGLKFGVMVIVAMLVMWVLPLGSLFGTPASPGETSGDVYILANQIGKSYTEFEKKCDDIPADLMPGPGEVTWHLVLNGFDGTPTALFLGSIVPSKTTSGVYHFYYKTSLSSVNTVQSSWFVNLDGGIKWNGDNLQTKLVVSHVCYVEEEEEKGKIKVTKTFTEDTTKEFNFTVTGLQCLI